MKAQRETEPQAESPVVQTSVKTTPEPHTMSVPLPSLRAKS